MLKLKLDVLVLLQVFFSTLPCLIFSSPKLYRSSANNWYQYPVVLGHSGRATPPAWRSLIEQSIPSSTLRWRRSRSSSSKSLTSASRSTTTSGRTASANQEIPFFQQVGSSFPQVRDRLFGEDLPRQGGIDHMCAPGDLQGYGYNSSRHCPGIPRQRQARRRRDPLRNLGHPPTPRL